MIILKDLSRSRRQIIIEEAAVLFNDKGYSSTSMKDIANSIGVKAASLYNHIESKQEILSVLLLFIANKFQEGIEDIDKSSYSFNEKLKEIIKMHIRVSIENRHITALITQDWKHLEEPSLTEFKTIRTNYQTVLKKILSNGMESGEFKITHLDITLNVILSSLRWIYNTEIYDNISNVGLAELERTILEIVFSGIEE
ncbi:MAG: TetR family transcriptional regulator [Flavobacteriaceae bacterium]|nr:MAG: TetR family transcriptional regulator [Flavobacteriaceae bacterium]